MEIKGEQYLKIKKYLPKQRGNVSIEQHKFNKYNIVCSRKWVQMEGIIQRVW